MENQSAEIAALQEELKWAKAKIAAMQLDLDRWAEKNRQWAEETVSRIVGQQEWPRSTSWKKFHPEWSRSDHLSELSREAERQEFEKNRWVQD